MLNHTIPPVYDRNSKVLILGSFPSVASRRQEFFYGHPQNRFWRVTAAVFDCPTPETTAQKREFLLKNGIALWDVIASCDIDGSADSTIRNVTPNDIGLILNSVNIRKIFVNGRTAAKYYGKYLYGTVGQDAEVLPSTSPANAAWSLERLIEKWRVLRQCTGE